MRPAIWSILIGLLVGASGCLCPQSLGEPVDDTARRAALLASYRPPEAKRVVYRTVLRSGGREISLAEVVKVFPEGGVSVAGVTDIGNTLYAVQIDPDGKGRVVSKSLPFSDRWLLDHLVKELLIPWNGPQETSELYRLPDESWALIHEENRLTCMFVFDEMGNWTEFRRLAGGRLRTRISLEWDEGSTPNVMRVDNRDKHYRVVRERVSSNP